MSLRNPRAYYGTLANLETTRTPDVDRFPIREEYFEVIGMTHTTLKRLTGDET